MTSSTVNNVKILFLLINKHHRPSYDQVLVLDLQQDEPIVQLISSIEKNALKKAHTHKDLQVHRVWQCTDQTTTFTPSGMRDQVEGCFRDNKVRKLDPMMEVQELQLLRKEVLLVEATMAREVWYLVIDHDKKLISRKLSKTFACDIFELSETAKRKFSAWTEHSDADHFIVRKSLISKLRSNIRLSDLTSMINEINLNDNSQAVVLENGSLTADIDLVDEEVLLVQVPGPDDLDEGEDEVPPLLSENLNMDYQNAYKRIRFIKAPSTNSKSAEYRNNQCIDSDIIYDGLYASERGAPDTNAPPIHLYHPIFYKFTRDANDPSIVPDSNFLTNVKKLMAGSSQMGDKEDVATIRLKNHLERLLEWSIPSESNIDNTRPDGVIMFDHVKPNLRVRTPIAILEFKRSLGEGGCDATIQAGNSMRKKLGEPESQPVVDKCCCPVFLIAGGGPWLCILGGIFITRFIVQRLTDMMWIGSAITHEEDRIYRVAKVLFALKNSLQDLRHFYEFVVATNIIPDFDVCGPPHPRHFPYPHSFIDHSGALCVFEYVCRLETDMRCVTYLAKIKDTDENKDEKVVVKFVDRYGAEVHQFLAELGHAPKLLYYGPLPDRTIYDSSESVPAAPKPMNAGHRSLGPTAPPDMKMVVMEYIAPSKPHLDDLDLSRDRISTVLETLHANGYVFGDLREPNVMFDANEKVKLIDFDWAGRYNINNRPLTEQIDIKKTWARFDGALKDSLPVGRYAMQPTAEDRGEVNEALKWMVPQAQDPEAPDPPDFFSSYAELTIDEQSKAEKAWNRLGDFANPPFATYPVGISTSISWPTDMESRSPIIPKHDDIMLWKMHRRWLGLSDKGDGDGDS